MLAESLTYSNDQTELTVQGSVDFRSDMTHLRIFHAAKIRKLNPPHVLQLKFCDYFVESVPTERKSWL